MIQPPQAAPQPPRTPFVVRVGDGTSPAAIYRGFKAQRSELTDQLEELEDTRENINSEIAQLPMTSPQRKALEDRVAEVDKRISVIDGMLASNSAQLAQAAAVPGAVVEPPRIIRQGPDEEVYVVAIVFMVIFLFPLSVAFARRIWKKSVTTVMTFPRELSDRLNRMEQALEATSIEVERIGEGQRFLTRLFTEGEAARALAPGAAGARSGSQLLERKQGTPERLP